MTDQRDINQLMLRLRDLVNEPRRQQKILQEKALWSQLCASMDVIEDAQMAVAAYLRPVEDNDCGLGYLALYGLFQALVLQQDAVFHLCEALQIQKNLLHYPKLKEIRLIRNQSTGHPTKKDRPGPTTYHQISRTTMKEEGFLLHTHDGQGSASFNYISSPELIQDQCEGVSEILESVIENLERDERQHKEKFRMEKLVSIFPSTLSYHFEKIYQGIRNKPDRMLGQINIRLVRKVCEDFRSALERRGIDLDTYDRLKYLYDEIGYPLERLERFFSDNSAVLETFNDTDAHIFADFIERKMDDLKHFAEEIDNDYSA